jgi:hypothetical protein
LTAKLDGSPNRGLQLHLVDPSKKSGSLLNG